MDVNATDKNYLVLTDQTGNYYAIPVEKLEGFKVTGEQRAQLEQALGDDVQGYGRQLHPGPGGIKSDPLPTSGVTSQSAATAGAQMDSLANGEAAAKMDQASALGAQAGFMGSLVYLPKTYARDW